MGKVHRIRSRIGRSMVRLMSIFLLALSATLTRAANPIFPGADPHAAFLEGTVWIYPTFSQRGKNFFAFKLTPQRTWQKVGPILDFADVPWLKNEKQTIHPWAPCITSKGTRYYFYYSVGPQRPEHPARIGVAVGTSPGGPFKDSGKVLLTGGNGFEAIDPMVFEDRGTRRFLLYVGGSAGAKLRVFELGDDMISLRKEVPIEQPKKFTEGPFMHFQGGLYHLTYSHGSWQKSDYSVHHSTSESPTGPWKYRGVVLQSDAKHKGPGHHSIFQIPASGKWYIAYHRWNNREGDGPFRGSRETCIDKLVHTEDGGIEPVVMTD